MALMRKLDLREKEREARKPLGVTAGGFALVSTLAVVLLLTVIVTAFMQSTSIERRTSASMLNIYRAQLAAESALEKALIQLTTYTEATTRQEKPLSDFNYIVARTGTTAAPNRRNYYLIKLAQGSPVIPKDGNGDVIKTELVSTGTDGEGSIEISPGDFQMIGLEALRDGQGNVSGACGFFIEDNGGKQYALALPKLNVVREHLLSLRELPLFRAHQTTLTMVSSGASDPFSTWIGANPDWKERVFTPRSLNHFATPALSPALQDSDIEVAHIAPDLNPLGEPKVNLRRLKYHLDNTRADDQTVGNARSRIVDALLDIDKPDEPASTLQEKWGGGHLGWLISPLNQGRYTEQEAKQIVANLIDYLDADLHPSTDNVDDPTYFGVEGKFVDTGNARGFRGHPYVNFVTTGCVFNLSRTGPGLLNSTRVLATVGLVNPWELETLPWNGSYSIEIKVTTSGSAIGGAIGTNAQSYFDTLLNEQLASFPVARIPARQAYCFPQRPGGGANYANFKSFFNAGNQQPAGMRFTNLSFDISRLRIFFESTDGTRSCVQTLDRLGEFRLMNAPSNFTLPIPSPPRNVSVVHKFTTDPSRTALFLEDDPRLSFTGTARWIQFTGEGGVTSDTPTPRPYQYTSPQGPKQMNVFRNMDPDEGDSEQGVPRGEDWYTSRQLSSHLYVRSPEPLPSDPASNSYTPGQPTGILSIGELGYISTGRPWQTLRLYSTGTGTRSDWTLLDFVTCGTYETETLSGQPFVRGVLNVNTLRPATTASLLNQVPVKVGPGTTTISAAGTYNSTLSAQTPMVFAGAIASGTSFITPGASTDFDREELIRRVANPLTTRSASFTIHCYGESRQFNRVVGRAMLRASVVLEPRSGGGVQARVLRVMRL
jgi:hypothetical protein